MKYGKRVAVLTPAAAFLALTAFAALAQQDKPLPGEEQDRMQVLFETNQQLQSGIVVNAARVRAQDREIERLKNELKTLRQKCAERCEDAPK
jgi:hypothetical protein